MKHYIPHLLMCIPMVLVGVLLIGGGAAAGALALGLMCAVMMVGMVVMMARGISGSHRPGHRDR
jgi:hypothetical protein